jgi:hypothetical protein
MALVVRYFELHLPIDAISVYHNLKDCEFDSCLQLDVLNTILAVKVVESTLADNNHHTK